MPSAAEVRLCQCFWRKSLFIYSCWQYLLFATRVTRDLLLQALPIKFHLIPDTPKTSATFSVKKATICAEFFGTFYRHRKYIKNITKLRKFQIINTEKFRAPPPKKTGERLPAAQATALNVSLRQRYSKTSPCFANCLQTRSRKLFHLYFLFFGNFFCGFGNSAHICVIESVWCKWCVLLLFVQHFDTQKVARCGVVGWLQKYSQSPPCEGRFF